jgi:hypothetical protein
MSAPTIILLKLAMGRYPAVDAVVPFSTLSDMCSYYFKRKGAVQYLSTNPSTGEVTDPTNAIYIADLEVLPTTMSLLLVRGDPGRALPGFVNVAKRSVKPIKGDPGSVPGASSHVAIATAEIAAGTDQGRHRVAMERARGISRSLMRDFLTYLLGRYADEFPEKFSAEKKRRKRTEKTEVISYRPTVKFHPQQNGNLKEDLQNGRIGGFKLTHGTAEFKGEANEPTVRSMNVQLHASIAPTKEIKRVTRLVQRVRETLNKISFEDLRLDLVDEGGRHIDSTQAIDLESLSNDDLRYCKTITSPDLGEITECYGSFHEPIKKFALKCLNAESYWKP